MRSDLINVLVRYIYVLVRYSDVLVQSVKIMPRLANINKHGARVCLQSGVSSHVIEGWRESRTGAQVNKSDRIITVGNTE